MKFNEIENTNITSSEKNNRSTAMFKIIDRIKILFSKGNDKEVKSEKEDLPEKILEDYKEENFDIYKKLAEVKGPYVEIAGPTEGGYKLVDISNIGKKLIVSNVWSNKGKIDFEANAKNLPLKSNSVGALFVSCLGGIQKDDPDRLKELNKKVSKWYVAKKECDEYEKLSHIEGRKLRNTALEEAFRTIENGGVLIWQGGVKEDYDTAQKLGFIIKQLKNRREDGIATIKGSSYNFIFEK